MLGVEEGNQGHLALGALLRRMPPLILRLITRGRRLLSAALLSDGVSGFARICDEWRTYCVVGCHEIRVSVRRLWPGEGLVTFGVARRRLCNGWGKLHMMCGALTNVITRAAVSPSDVHDNVLFRELFLGTARHFRMRKLTADMAYLSGSNYELARDFGLELFVPFKSNTAPWVDDGTAWSAALLEFLQRHNEFMDEYHQRSNAESTFWALKRTFPSQVRMEKHTGQVNEKLCKVLAYNFSGVAREVRMRGVKPHFPSEADRLAKAVAAIYR